MSNIEDEMVSVSNAHKTDTIAKHCNTITHAEWSVQRYLNSFVEKPPPPHTAKQDEIGNSSCRFDLCELDHALTSELETRASFDRVVCCNTSQSLYCKECYSLLVPDHSLPIPISCRRRTIGETTLDNQFEGRPLRVPFNLHIILDDRRGSATGIHAMALLNGTNEKGAGSNHHGEDKDDSQTDSIADSMNVNPSNDFSDLGLVKLIDLANNDEIPNYRQDDASTFLLLPSEGESVPLESVAQRIQTLVVLDIKWTKSRVWSRNKALSTLQKVHLSSPPEKSYYWRWHNAGNGMTSTMEAIYYAAFETMQAKRQHLLESGQISQSDSNKLLIDEKNLIHLLWLFGHQRAATFSRAQNEGKPAPSSVEGKEMQRALRKQKGTWRQLRHEEDERRPKEKNGPKEGKKEPPA